MMLNRKQYKALIVTGIFMLMLPLLVNHRPIYISINGQSYFPALTGSDLAGDKQQEINFNITDVKALEEPFHIMPLIPWSPGKSDLVNIYSSPFEEQFMQTGHAKIILPFIYRHWLGTDGKGTDVLAGLLYGFRYSMLLAILALLITAIPGVFMGSIAGYYGNNGFRVRISVVLAVSIALLYFFCVAVSGWPAVIISIAAGVVLYLILNIFLKNAVYLKSDSLIMGFMQVLMSVPALIVIIAGAAIFKGGTVSVALILGIMMWPETVRFTRAQVLNLKNSEYIHAAKALGYSDSRIIVHHLLKNGIGPVVILLCFAFSSFILAESTLSFLGAGIPGDIVTWGSILASGRNNFQAWWLVLIPGSLLMMVIYMLLSFADRFQEQQRSFRP